MNFFCLGIDYKTAPLSAREAICRKGKAIADFWAGRPALRAAILATCNRFEIYSITDDEAFARAHIDIFKESYKQFSGYGYALYGKREVFRHILRLATGLESQIKGEPQILRQLAAWSGKKDFPQPLLELVYDALLASHEIRSRSGLKETENNIAALVFDDILEKVEEKGLLDIVVAGTGKIAELFALYRPQGTRIYFAAHKNIAKAKVLAGRAAGRALDFKELPGLLASANVLISATSSPHIIFNKEYFYKIAPARKGALYIYDLAVPRDVDTAAGNIKGIILKDMDGLSDAYERHNLALNQSLALAEYLVGEAVKDYERGLNEKTSQGRHEAQSAGY